MANYPQLSDDQVQEMCLILSSGCDRTTACKYAGTTVEQLQAAMCVDQQLARQIRRAEATAEIAHVRRIRLASEDVKHWRASCWWLQHSAPNRYGGRPSAISSESLEDFVINVARMLQTEIADLELRERVTSQLAELGPWMNLSHHEEAHRDDVS